MSRKIFLPYPAKTFDTKGSPGKPHFLAAIFPLSTLKIGDVGAIKIETRSPPNQHYQPFSVIFHFAGVLL